MTHFYCSNWDIGSSFSGERIPIRSKQEIQNIFCKWNWIYDNLFWCSSFNILNAEILKNSSNCYQAINQHFQEFLYKVQKCSNKIKNFHSEIFKNLLGVNLTALWRNSSACSSYIEKWSARGMTHIVRFSLFRCYLCS